MAAPSPSRSAAAQRAGPPADGRSQACYVYGIFPGDVELTSDGPGVGDPPAPLSMVRHDGLAALVSPVDPARPLGSPQDLMAHQDILDASATAAPVLPMRFGAVLAGEEAVATELLGAHRDEFAAALGQLDGRAQYVVKGRYVERAILAEVLSEDPQAARLRQEIGSQDPDATRDARIALGEMISDAVAVKREQDTNALGTALAGYCVASVVREPTHELDAVHAAFLVDASRAKQLDRAVGDLGERWAGRIELRLLGPMAAYDFVDAAQRGTVRGRRGDVGERRGNGARTPRGRRNRGGTRGRRRGGDSEKGTRQTGD
jgi:hypothetical protein